VYSKNVKIKDINVEHTRLLVPRDPEIYIIEICESALKRIFQVKILLRESHPIIRRDASFGHFTQPRIRDIIKFQLQFYDMVTRF